MWGYSCLEMATVGIVMVVWGMALNVWSRRDAAAAFSDRKFGRTCHTSPIATSGHTRLLTKPTDPRTHLPHPYRYIAAPQLQPLYAATDPAAAAAPPPPAPTEPPAEIMVAEGRRPSVEWELDCYSRPVLQNKKKLWELLICDNTGALRMVQSIPANKVNSTEVRKRVRELIDVAEVKPVRIRYFRRAMMNMMKMSLTDISDGVSILPSRCTYALNDWLEEREKNVYPKMPGFQPSLQAAPSGGLDLSMMAQPDRLPDQLKAENTISTTVTATPASATNNVNERNSTTVTEQPLHDDDCSVDETNIGAGSLCPIPPGVIFITPRAAALSNWLGTLELVSMRGNLRENQLVMDVGLEQSYLVARLDGDLRGDGKMFEISKARARGLHFICVKEDEEGDEVAGFWLLRQPKS